MTLAYTQANAQFTSGQVLTATQLNSALAAPAITGGSINGASIGSTHPNSGAFTTLSASGMATLNGLTTPATGQFYAGSGASISRVQDRLFVGPAALNNGTSVAVQPDWLTTYQIAKGRSYGFIMTSQMAVLNGSPGQDSLMGIVAGVQSAGRPSSGSQVIGITSIGVNNANTGHADNSAWALYLEAFRDTVTAGNGAAYGLELDTMNFVSAVGTATDPYQQSSDQTIGAQLAAGGGFPSAGQYPSSAAINIQNNNSTFDKGIVFGSNSISGDDGTNGTGIAIALAKGHQIQWYGPGSVKTSQILSTGTTTSAGIQQLFSDNAVNFSNSGGNSVFGVLGVANAVNGLTALGAVTGAPPQLVASGSDTNVPLQLTTKGSGNILLNAPAVVTSTATTGNTLSVSATGNTGSGAQIFLAGNGSTTPNKFIRAFNGHLQCVNSTDSTVICDMDDLGNVTFNGNVIGTGGSFTTLSANGNDALTYENTSAQSIANNAATTVTGWTKSFDRLNANFNASTGIFTAPATGYYHVDAGLLYASATASLTNESFQVQVVGNGATLCTGQGRSQQTASSVGYSATTSCLVSLTAGQTIAVQAFQNSGSTVALATAAGGSYVSIHRIP